MLVVFKTLVINQRFNYIQSLNLYEDSLQNHHRVLLNHDVIYAMRKIIKYKSVTFLKLSRNLFEF